MRAKEFASTAFVTVPETGSSSSVLTKARSWGDSVFGAASPYTVFMIDMSTRRLGIYSSRSVYSLLNTGRANTITDNVYRYASLGDYAGCAEEAFTEMAQIMRGEKIAQPMKIASNVLLALICSILISYVLAVLISPFVVQAVGLGGPPAGAGPGGPPAGAGPGGPPQS